jgi:hypothetical protein
MPSRPAFLDFVCFASLTLALTLPACSDDSPPDYTGFVSACESAAQPFVEGIQPDQPVDYLAFRSETRSSVGWNVKLEGERGTVCATAGDFAACKKKVDDVRVLTSACDLSNEANGCRVYYFVYTRGDDVQVVDFDQLTAFIGHVDNVTEAMHIGRGPNNIQFGCPPDYVAPARYKQVADGFELIGQDVNCLGEGDYQLVEVRVHVGSDGSFRELSRRVVEHRKDGKQCITMPA